MLIVARAYFSADFNSRTPFSPLDFADYARQGLEACSAARVTLVELGNEPNIEREGQGWNWRNGEEFGEWQMQLLQIAQSRHPDLQFGFPALSPNDAASLFLSQATAAATRHNWIAAHSYWWSPAGVQPYPIDGVIGGASWRPIRDRFRDMLLLITEFSNNSKNVSALAKGQQYIDYYRALRNEPNVGAAFAFALSWPGQDENHEGWTDGKYTTEIPAVLGASM
jgi:hypothetical protein